MKHSEFHNATVALQTNGTTMSSFNIISLPTNGMCIIDDYNTIKPHKPLNLYPNSLDKYNNVYFGYENVNEQAIRIGIRELCVQTKFTNNAKEIDNLGKLNLVQRDSVWSSFETP